MSALDVEMRTGSADNSGVGGSAHGELLAGALEIDGAVPGHDPDPTAGDIDRGGGRAAVELLPALAAGELTGTLAFSERGTGAHFYSPELRAHHDGESVYIDGRKLGEVPAATRVGPNV